MQVFSAQAPTRIDLAGGTLDLWPIHRLLPHKGTVNIALSLFATTTLEVGGSKGTFELVSTDQNASVRGSYEEVLAASVLPLHREMLRNLWSPQLPALRLTTSCQSPQGAGLGGSSSLAITIASALAQARNALLGEDLPSKDHLVAQAQDIEASCLATPTGIQDYWGAVNGGITLISYPPGKPQVEVFPLAQMPEVEDQVVICFSGKSRLSGINNWQVFKGAMEGNGRLLDLLQGIGYHGACASEAMRAGNWQQLLQHSHEEWQLRIQLGEGIETEETRSIYHAAIGAGAYTARICGAGGGGVMALFAPPEKKQGVIAAAQAAGGQILAAQLTDQGLKLGAQALG